jgi:hypothetical protein
MLHSCVHDEDSHWSKRLSDLLNYNKLHYNSDGVSLYSNVW